MAEGEDPEQQEGHPHRVPAAKTGPGRRRTERGRWYSRDTFICTLAYQLTHYSIQSYVREHSRNNGEMDLCDANKEIC